MKTITNALHESDIRMKRDWPKGIHFEDAVQANSREPLFRLPRPQIYYARTTAFGGLVTRGTTQSQFSATNVIDPSRAADDWLTARYLKSHWKKPDERPR